MPFRGNPQDWPVWAPGHRSWNLGSAAIARTLKRTRTTRRITPDRRFGLPYEELTLRTDDGVTLAAWFVPGKHPQEPRFAVLVHHHYGGQRATTLPWLALFHELGVASLVFDGRGHAASGSTPPGRGSFPKRTSDVRAAAAELHRRGFDDLVGFGQSQGAAVLAMGTGGRADLRGLILDSGPAPDMLCAAWGLAGNMLGKDAGDHVARALLAARIIPGTEPVQYLGLLWLSLAYARKKPLLWVHGERDAVIRRRWSAAWYRTLAGRGWSNHVVPSAEHVRTLQVDPEGTKAAVEGLLQRVRHTIDHERRSTSFT